MASGLKRLFSSLIKSSGKVVNPARRRQINANGKVAVNVACNVQVLAAAQVIWQLLGLWRTRRSAEGRRSRRRVTASRVAVGVGEGGTHFHASSCRRGVQPVRLNVSDTKDFVKLDALTKSSDRNGLARDCRVRAVSRARPNDAGRRCSLLIQRSAEKDLCNTSPNAAAGAHGQLPSLAV